MAGIPPLTVFPTFAWADRTLLESDLRVLWRALRPLQPEDQ